jgi:hypothetical protein
MIHLGEPSKGAVVQTADKLSLKRGFWMSGELPHDEDDFLWTAAMYFKVEGITFEGFALVANLSDWTHATTRACMRVEHGVCDYFLVAEVGHGRGHVVARAPKSVALRFAFWYPFRSAITSTGSVNCLLFEPYFFD